MQMKNNHQKVTDPEFTVMFEIDDDESEDEPLVPKLAPLTIA